MNAPNNNDRKWLAVLISTKSWRDQPTPQHAVLLLDFYVSLMSILWLGWVVGEKCFGEWKFLWHIKKRETTWGSWENAQKETEVL